MFCISIQSYCPVRLLNLESTQHILCNKCSLARSQWTTYYSPPPSATSEKILNIGTYYVGMATLIFPSSDRSRPGEMQNIKLQVEMESLEQILKNP